MRVVRVDSFGGPEVLVPAVAPDPEPAAGQVVVDVAVADTLFVETVIRRGLGAQWFGVVPPYVPGDGVAGTVRAVGAGVDAGWVNRRVITRTLRYGAYAERALAMADALIPVPDGLDLPEAAAIIHDGRTAMRLLTSAEVRSGERVLVTAAAGGMGVLLVQLARAAGARVIAAARGPRKLALLEELGADLAVDYGDPEWAARVRTATGGVDVVFDGAGGQLGVDAFGLTNDGGRFSAHGAPGGGFAPIDQSAAERRGIRLRGIQDVQQIPGEDRLTERALGEVAAGRLRPVIGQTFPLDQAAGAHAAIESRAVLGKTLLLV